MSLRVAYIRTRTESVLEAATRWRARTREGMILSTAIKRASPASVNNIETRVWSLFNMVIFITIGCVWWHNVPQFCIESVISHSQLKTSIIKLFFSKSRVWGNICSVVIKTLHRVIRHCPPPTPLLNSFRCDNYFISSGEALSFANKFSRCRDYDVSVLTVRVNKERNNKCIFGRQGLRSCGSSIPLTAFKPTALLDFLLFPEQTTQLALKL